MMTLDEYMEQGNLDEEDRELMTDEIEALYQEKLDREAMEDLMLDSYHW